MANRFTVKEKMSRLKRKLKVQFPKLTLAYQQARTWLYWELYQERK